MDRNSYWRTLQDARVSRRRMLAGGAAGVAGVASLALVGCSSSNKSSSNTPTAGNAATAASPTPSQSTPAKSKGGVYRSFGFDALALDTFDPHETQFGPMYNMHSSVFSKILKYDDDAAMIMSTDLAASMPEQPDQLTYVINLRQGVKFHSNSRAQTNFPAVAGRELTADDVKYSFERQANPNSPQKALFYRAEQWKTIDTITVVDKYTLKITTKAPTAPFLHYLADRNSFIVAKETVDANDTMNTDKAMIGTGPFQLDHFTALQVVSVRRNPSWFAADDNPRGIGTGRPFLDGVDSLWTPQSDSTQEAALDNKQVDATGFSDDATTVRVSKQPGMTFSEIGTSGFLNSRLWASQQSPFKDERLRQAIHLAVDRQKIGEQMFPGAPGLKGFLADGPVAWPITAWALPQNQLLQKPGYRTDQAGRAQDLANAKQLWAAASGPSSIKFIFAGVPSYIPDKARPEIVQELQAALGLNAQVDIDPTGYNGLAQAFLHDAADETSAVYPASFGFDNGWIDLDDWVYPYFHTGGTKNSFLISDSKLDSMLDGQRAEFDHQKRQSLGYDIQNYLLDNVCARIDYVSPITRGVAWDYVQNQWNATWYGSNFLMANVWIDQTASTYSGRPA